MTFINRSFIFTYLLIFIFISWAGIEGDLYSILYALTIPFYYYIILLVITAPFIIFRYIPFLSILFILPKVIFDIVLIFDLLVFNVWQFHIDLLFINMFLHDFKGVGMSISDMLLAIFIIVAVFVFNFLVFIQSKKNTNTIIKTIITLIIISIFILIGQSIHTYSHFHKEIKITKYTPYPPYYLPLTSSSIMNDYFEKPKETKSVFQDNNEKSLFNYPLKKIEFNKDNQDSKPNILFLVLESWRYDMLNKEVTPYMFDFAKGAYRFDKHYSGGSTTVAGLFSLFYGLYTTNMIYAQSNPYKFQSIFTKSLEEQGYDIESFTYSNFNRFSLKNMFFGNIQNDKFHELHDSKVLESFKESLKSQDKKPWFKFVFLTSSHHDYHYPDKFMKYKPIPTIYDSYVLNKYTNPTPFINDYKNSLLYVDSVLNDIIKEVKDKNTMIIVTSDHGEEFNENNKGFWTHGGNFTKWQIQVPLIIKMPHQKNKKIISRTTSHIDIVPTILEHLKIKNQSSDYSSGFNLFKNTNEKRLLVQYSYKDKSYLIDDIIYSTGIKSRSYNVESMDLVNTKFDFENINKIRKKEREFLGN